MSLVIEIHQRFGHISRFSQNDPELIARALQLLRPSHVFSQPRLLLSNGLSFSLFNTANISRIEIPRRRPDDGAGRELLPRLFKINDESEFLQRAAELKTLINTQLSWDEPGALLRWYALLQLSGGERVFAEVESRAGLPSERYIHLNRIFEQAVLVLERDDGGVCLVNPGLIERITAFPGLPDLPGHAIAADHETF